MSCASATGSPELHWAPLPFLSSHLPTYLSYLFTALCVNLITLFLMSLFPCFVFTLFLFVQFLPLKTYSVFPQTNVLNKGLQHHKGKRFIGGGHYFFFFFRCLAFLLFSDCSGESPVSCCLPCPWLFSPPPLCLNSSYVSRCLLSFRFCLHLCSTSRFVFCFCSCRHAVLVFS